MGPKVMYRASSRQFNLTAIDDAGDPLNLTGAKLWLTAKKAVTDLDVDAVFQLTSDVSGGILILDAEAGLAVASVAPSNTSALPNAKFTQLFYDWRVRLANGEIQTLEMGIILVRPIVTLATT